MHAHPSTPVAMILAMTAAAQAGTVYDIRIENKPSIGLEGDPRNSVIIADVARDLGFAPGTLLTVTGIGWGVDLTAHAPSWLDDMGARVGSLPRSNRDLHLYPALFETFPGSGRYESPVLILRHLGLPNIALFQGIARVELFEYNNDFTDATPEGFWESGYVRLLVFETPPPPPPVPLPSAALLGVAGLSALGAARRRR